MLTRRQFGLSAASIAAMASVRPLSAATAWQPTSEIEFVIPFSVGGGSDIFARVIAQIMAEEKLVSVPVMPTNRPGGNSAVGLSYVVANRKANPHTLYLMNPPVLLTPIKVQGAFKWTELRPLMNLMLDDYIIFVRADAPWKDAREFVEDAKKEPLSINVASGGAADDMAVQVLSQGSGIKLNAVRFDSGGECITALLGGHAKATFGNPLEYLGHLEAGRVRALGVFRETRFERLPDIPTLKEQDLSIPPYQMWRGVGAPAGIPEEAAAYWEDVLAKVAASPRMKTYIAENSATLVAQRGKDFAAYLQEQDAMYRKILNA